MINKKIFITGGAGYLGKNLIKRFYQENLITVFSRDEAKHYFLKKEYPSVKFVIGDVRNYDLLKRASENHDIGIFAASLKQIEACDDNYEEAEQIIVRGAFNSRRVAEENGFEAACFVSSDKSRSATTIYGAMKYIAGESFIINPNTKCRLSTAVYGNILNSTGSIIPLIWQHLRKNSEASLFHSEMTRFLLTVENAIDLIEIGLRHNSVNVIPICSSFKVKDLMEIFQEEFSLKYKLTQPRMNEKIHEIMASSEELPRMISLEGKGAYLMYQDRYFNAINLPNNEYSSRDSCVSKGEFKELLKANGYFRP